MFTQRSAEKELIDLGPNYYSHREYEQCMQKLFSVHRYLGVFRRTLQTLKRFSATSSILDIGCGNGLFLLNLKRYFPTMTAQGADISPAAIQLAQREMKAWAKRHGEVNVSFELQQQETLNLPENSIDIILATMVCHHLKDEDLVVFLQQSLHAARKAVIINDLHRHSWAYHLYRLISPLLFRNRLITHDGLISIQRGFTRSEWELLLQRANIANYEIKWRFPFQWHVILWK